MGSIGCFNGSFIAFIFSTIRLNIGCLLSFQNRKTAANLENSVRAPLPRAEGNYDGFVRIMKQFLVESNFSPDSDQSELSLRASPTAGNKPNRTLLNAI